MPKPNKESRELVFALFAASARIQHQLEADLSHIKGISFSEFELLQALENSYNATATRVGLAEAIGRTPSGVTRALRPLEKLGYVITKKDLRDARRSLATLTPQGVKLVRSSSVLVDEVVADLTAIADLDEPDRKTMIEFLGRLTHEP